MSTPEDSDETPSIMQELTSTTGLRQRKNLQSMHTYQPVKNTLDDRGSTGRTPHVHFTEPSTASNTPLQGSYVESLMGGMRPSEESKLHGIAIATIDNRFRYFTIWLFSTWIILVCIMYMIVPSENIVYLSGLEQRAAFTSMSLILVSFLSKILPLFGVGKVQGRDRAGFSAGRLNVDSDRGDGSRVEKIWKNINRNMSGILLGGLSIQVVAFMTDFFMAFFPVPVVLDPVLGTRVHVLRWCEWFPCATFMTFMMEGADLFWPTDGDLTDKKADEKTEDGPPSDFFKMKYVHAAAQGGAVFLGLMFPFCPGFKTWICAITTAVMLYLTNYPRLLQRRSEIPNSLREGATVEEAERYNSAVTALRLRYICIAVWSIIVALYFVSSVGPTFAPEDSILRNPAANMCCECFFDVLSKVLFLVTIMDVHHAIFDPFARSERRIEELRKLMSAVWESSSDPIAISVRTGPSGGVTTLLSPAFFALGGGKGSLRRLSKDAIKDLFCNKSILFKLSNDVFERGMDANNTERCEVKADDILSVDYTEFGTGIGLTSGIVFAGQLVTPEMGALRAVAESVVKAWQSSGRGPVFSHDLSWKSENKKDMLVYSEAKVSRLDENSLIVIIRDISERVHVFETEKKMLMEATSRQKDAEANRFTRHEVKNGLLAAIGLHETLCEAQKSHLFKDALDDSGFGLRGETGDSANVVRCMNELGKSLHETLDTIMVEAMTRDLIHDVYRPHNERIDVATSICGDEYVYSFGNLGNLRRFPLITKPSPLPRFYLDPSLLRYLHRQVLSNACKYGKTGGDVLTEIIYYEHENKLKINVINLPGEFHDQLVKMGDSAEGAVFRKGAQIHETIIVETASTVASSVKKAEMATHPGDGGWIIQKCAKVMKGQCSIKFEDSRTVFSLVIPAKPWGSTEVKTSVDVKTFRLPAGTWGFCIDDSKIQQKLMAKFFEYAGIPSDRIHIFGRDSDEIMSFVDNVVSFMDEHMGDHILLIADENLDIVDEVAKHKTISGSQLVEIIRARLLPEQERCLFSLIRSANDSASDIAIYNSRAHGFLAKAPIKKGSVLETLAPLWFARYPLSTTRIDDESEATNRRRSDSFSSLESSLSLQEAIASSPLDILLVVNEIDKLFAHTAEDTPDLVREKLHALKGDLLTMKGGSKVMTVVGAINSFRDNYSEDQQLENWQVLREQITSLASQYDSSSDR